MGLRERVAKRFILAKSMTLEEAKAILGFSLESDPTESEVEKRRREFAIKNHPDLGGDADKMVEVNIAADILSGKRKPAPSDPPSRPEPPPAPYQPPPRSEPTITKVTFEEAEAAAGGVPHADWKFKTQNGHSGYGDISTMGFVLCGKLGDRDWLFVAVENHTARNAFSNSESDIWWMKKKQVSGDLRDVAPKVIRELWADFPRLKDGYNAKVEILKEGVRFGPMMLYSHGKTVSFKDAMDLLGELGSDDPWKNRKITVDMVTKSEYDRSNGMKDVHFITLTVNGRDYKLQPESVEYIENKTDILDTVMSGHRWRGKKTLTRARDGGKAMKTMAEHLTHEPKDLRDALSAAAAQMGVK